MGWGTRQIARHVGCGRSAIERFELDPSIRPRYNLAEAILELRDCLQAGQSKWGMRIKALRAHGMGTAEISRLVGVSRQTILIIESDPSHIPEHATGLRLLEVYRRCIRDER